MSAPDFDVVVIGGGIQGAGIAQAAAVGGYSVLMLEQSALAAGTSSRSSKLIHGGLRYLESAQFSLVHECLQERSLLLKNAPELVHLTPFFIPVYRSTSRRPWQLQIGLTLYRLLTGRGRGGHFQRLPRRQWHTLDGLDSNGLQAVFQYYDAQTDDSLLTRAVVQSALAYGAELRMPATLEQAELHDRGCIVHYLDDGKRAATTTCRVLVNASGPWANLTLGRVSPQQPPLDIDLVQGSHVVLPGQLQRGCYYMEAPADRRAVFAMPWYGRILLGTTETPYQGDPARVAPLDGEIDYLLATLGHYFPSYRDFEKAQIESAFAGLRVLPRGNGDSPQRAFSRPRDTVFHCDRRARPRLLTLYGGKLTAYRATAEKALARLSASLPQRRPRGSTRSLPLTRPE